MMNRVPIQLWFRVELDATLVAQEGSSLVALLVDRHVLRAEQLPTHVAHGRRFAAVAGPD